MGLGIKTFIKEVIRTRKEKVIQPINTVVEDSKLLHGKVALILGGSGGIGMAIARKYLDCGAKVIISGTNESKLKAVIQQLHSENCKYIMTDLNNVSTFQDRVNEAGELFGKIDILVCSAGIHANYPGLDFLNVDERQYDSIMDLNLKGTFFFCQAAAKYFIDNKIKGAHVLIVSSQSALEPAWSPYRLSKHGVAEITKGMAQRLLEHDIIVNGIGPGPTATAMQEYKEGGDIFTWLNPIHRYTMPEEVAEYAKMLVSPLGDTIVGDTLYMSGGRGIIEIR